MPALGFLLSSHKPCSHPQTLIATLFLTYANEGSGCIITWQRTTPRPTSVQDLMANGSPRALEALMVQPFGIMHRAGLSGTMPSQQPPSYSCRSGLSVLMPVLGRSCPEAIPFKLQVWQSVGALCLSLRAMWSRQDHWIAVSCTVFCVRWFNKATCQE